MLHKFSSLLVLTLVMMSSAAFAQTEVRTATPNADIPDDGYIGILDGNDGTGTDAGMTCATVNFSNGLTVSSVTMDLAVTHTWLGDLTVKVKSPSGTVVAPMVRPAGDAGAAGNVPTDDGDGCCGDSSNLDGNAPVSFADGNSTDAEQMGLGLGTDDVESGSFRGNGDVSPNSGLFSTFAGESANGAWQVCVGDGAALDTGVFNAVTLTVIGGGAGCALSFVGTPTATYTASPRRIRFTGQASNGGSATTVRLVINYSRMGGNPMGTLRFGPQAVPSGGPFPFGVNQTIPGNAPSGTYNLNYQLVSNGVTCDTATGSVVITPGRFAEVATELAAAAPQTKSDPQPARTAPSYDAWVASPDFEFGAAAPVSAAKADAGAVVASPNPFASRTEIAFSLERATDVSLAVYDVRGREVARLADGTMEAGQHSLTFDAASLPSGVYVYRLVAGTQVETGRMTLVQ